MIVHQFDSQSLLDVHDFVLHYDVPTVEASLLCRHHSNPKVFSSFGVEFKPDDAGTWRPHTVKTLSFSTTVQIPEHLWRSLQDWAESDCEKLVNWMLRCPTTYRKAMRNILLRELE